MIWITPQCIRQCGIKPKLISVFEFLNINLSKGKKSTCVWLASALMTINGLSNRNAFPRGSSEGAFPRSWREEDEEDEEEALKWVAH